MDKQIYLVWSLILLKSVNHKLKYIKNIYLLKNFCSTIFYFSIQSSAPHPQPPTMFVTDPHRILGFVKRTTENNVLVLSQWPL
jgi:hypothetical protein